MVGADEGNSTRKKGVWSRIGMMVFWGLLWSLVCYVPIYRHGPGEILCWWIRPGHLLLAAGPVAAAVCVLFEFRKSRRGDNRLQLAERIIELLIGFLLVAILLAALISLML